MILIVLEICLRSALRNQSKMNRLMLGNSPGELTQPGKGLCAES